MTKTYTVRCAYPTYRNCTVVVEADTPEKACELALAKAEADASGWREADDCGEATFVDLMGEGDDQVDRDLVLDMPIPPRFAERRFGDVVPDGRFVVVLLKTSGDQLHYSVAAPDAAAAVDKALYEASCDLEGDIREIEVEHVFPGIIGKAVPKNDRGGYEAERKAVGEAVLNYHDRRDAIVTLQTATLIDVRSLMAAHYTDLALDRSSHISEWLTQMDRAIGLDATEAAKRIADLESFARTTAALTKDQEPTGEIDDDGDEELFDMPNDDAVETLHSLIDEARAFYPELAPPDAAPLVVGDHVVTLEGVTRHPWHGVIESITDDLCHVRFGGGVQSFDRSWLKRQTIEFQIGDQVSRLHTDAVGVIERIDGPTGVLYVRFPDGVDTASPTHLRYAAKVEA